MVIQAISVDYCLRLRQDLYHFGNQTGIVSVRDRIERLLCTFPCMKVFD
jgi:hypothetical protein